MLRIIALSIAVLSTLVLTACSTSADSPPVHAQVRLAAGAEAAQVANALAGMTVLHNRMGVAQAAPLPAGLSVALAGDPAGDYRAGDVVYHPATREIVVFTASRYRASNQNTIRLGHITAGMRQLADCGQTCAVRLTLTTSGY